MSKTSLIIKTSIRPLGGRLAHSIHVLLNQLSHGTCVRANTSLKPSRTVAVFFRARGTLFLTQLTYPVQG